MKVVFYRGMEKTNNLISSHILADPRFGKTLEEIVQSWRSLDAQFNWSPKPIREIIKVLAHGLEEGSIRTEG